MCVAMPQERARLEGDRKKAELARIEVERKVCGGIPKHTNTQQYIKFITYGTSIRYTVFACALIKFMLI